MKVFNNYQLASQNVSEVLNMRYRIIDDYINRDYKTGREGIRVDINKALEEYKEEAANKQQEDRCAYLRKSVHARMRNLKAYFFWYAYFHSLFLSCKDDKYVNLVLSVKDIIRQSISDEEEEVMQSVFPGFGGFRNDEQKNRVSDAIKWILS